MFDSFTKFVRRFFGIKRDWNMKKCEKFVEFAVSVCRMHVAVRKSLFQNMYAWSYWLSQKRFFFMTIFLSYFVKEM